VSWAICWVGWALALAAAWTLRRRMGRLADAEHELRGAATAIGLAGEASPAVALQLDRMEAALADLAAARGACPPPASDLDAGRLAQVLGNVIANAAEHGVGPVEVRAVHLELLNRDRATGGGQGRGRGRGLVIARRAASELGGSVRVERKDGITRTVVELPGNERHNRAA
jgi:signal transduction histidine kinase